MSGQDRSLAPFEPILARALAKERDSRYQDASEMREELRAFYRLPQPVEILSQLSGKRIAIGPEGSGAHSLALALLAINGIEPGGATTFLNMEGENAAAALLGVTSGGD